MRAFLKQMLFVPFMVILCGCKKEPAIPIISTTPVTSITHKSAFSGGHIISDGGAEITSKGVCWSLNPQPTISDSYTQSTGAYDFTCILTDLSPSTVYWVRAYATNSAGTGYGVGYRMKTYEGTIMDIDGNTYNTVKIGSQTWLVENLRVTRLNDGTEIQLVTVTEMWRGLPIPKYSYCIDDYALSSYKKNYGAYYNCYAVLTGKLCPVGWHVSTDNEWGVLINFLGGTSVADKIKSTTDWEISITGGGGSNESNFTGLPAGLGNGWSIGRSAYWWAVTGLPDYIGYCVLRSYLNSIARSYVDITNYFNTTGTIYSSAYSVRCVKDSI